MKNVAICRLFFILAFCSLIVSNAMMHAALSNEPTKPDNSNTITEVTLQRTWCLGTCPVDKVTLRSDGTAEYTVTISTKPSGNFKGTFPEYDFTRLVQWLESEDIFTMKDSYGSLALDAPDQIITIVRNNQRKTIINHTVNSSLKFWSMEQAIKGIASDIKWLPVQSGIRGKVIYRSKTSTDFQASPNVRIYIRAPGAQVEFQVEADKDGNFQIPLLPNTYVVRSLISDQSQQVIVQPNQFSDVIIKIDKHEEPHK
jgi:hypothetical protein